MARVFLDTADRPRMRGAAEVLTAAGYPDAANAVRALPGATELGLWLAALGELRPVPEAILHAARLTPDAATSAVPSAPNARPQQDGPSFIREAVR